MMPRAKAERRETHMKDLNFEAQKPEGLLYVGSPRQYRADCKSGQFKIGASQTVGNRLKMEVIAARFLEGEFFGYDWKKWANIIVAPLAGAWIETLTV